MKKELSPGKKALIEAMKKRNDVIAHNISVYLKLKRAA